MQSTSEVDRRKNKILSYLVVSHTRPPLPGSNHVRPLHLWTEWQTGVKILPCPKLRLRAVKTYSCFETPSSVVEIKSDLFTIRCYTLSLVACDWSLDTRLHFLAASQGTQRTLRLKQEDILVGCVAPACPLGAWSRGGVRSWKVVGHRGMIPGVWWHMVLKGEYGPRGMVWGVRHRGRTHSVMALPPLWTEWQTPLKTLPSRNFVGGL